ncbi:MAG: ribonuclease R [Firmicutes bacterium]|nr:ribonuclease R [Bacillota bacterium]
MTRERMPRERVPSQDKQVAAIADRLFALLQDVEDMHEDELIKQLTQSREGSKTVYRIYTQYRHEGWLQVDETRHVRTVTRQGVLRINPRGFGFVVSQEFPGDDVFVPERWLLGARHQDQVLVWTRSSERGLEGKVMNVISRATETVVGELQKFRGGWRVVPQDQRRPVVELSRIPRHISVKPGDIVLAQITEWPLDPHRAVRGKFMKRLGHPEQPGMDVTVLACEHQLPTAFPRDVMQEAQALPQTATERDIQGRWDLSDQFIVTIDGADSKDLDDAISVERQGENFIVGVHIADVSYYVHEGAALDSEARSRGTSVYLVDRVIPMLPERLSNGIASLNPGLPRLTVSAIMTVNAQGEVIAAEFGRSLIRSNFRLTYEGVNKLLAGEAEDTEGILPWLKIAEHVRNILRQRRIANGMIDFDLPESKVILDAQGHPVDVVLRERGIAETLIEEFMLLANEQVAHELIRHNLPGLFRVHDEPDPEKLLQFRELIGALGYRLPAKVTPKALQELLTRIQGTDEEKVIRGALLRAMRQARYAAKNTGHFGLASPEYLHFTSPIRRYPDLWVHRVLTHYLAGDLTPERLESWRELAPDVAEIASTRERQAMEAERDSVALKEAEFMANKVGETFNGVVSGVTNFGIFVELPNLIEGLVRLEALPDDYWVYDAEHYVLAGERTGRRYRLGSTVKVQVARVDVALKRIDFQLIEEETASPQHNKDVPRKKTHRSSAAL